MLDPKDFLLNQWDTFTNPEYKDVIPTHLETYGPHYWYTFDVHSEHINMYSFGTFEDDRDGDGYLVPNSASMWPVGYDLDFEPEDT